MRFLVYSYKSVYFVKYLNKTVLKMLSCDCYSEQPIFFIKIKIEKKSNDGNTQRVTYGPIRMYSMIMVNINENAVSILLFYITPVNTNRNREKRT